MTQVVPPTVSNVPNDLINKIRLAEPDACNALNQMQDRIDPLRPKHSLSDENYLKHSKKLNEIHTEAVVTIDKIMEHQGKKTLSRLIFELVSRVAEVAEQHILQKRNRERDRKDKIEAKVLDQKSIKNYQALTQGFGGAFMGVLGFAGAFIGGPVGDICKQLAGLPRPAMDMVISHLDGKVLPMQHESSLYLNSVQSEKQAVESLKNLPEQLRNLILELMRLELRAIESISQR